MHFKLDIAYFSGHSGYMEILFLGVGEACDERCPNTSLHIVTGKGSRFLLDCGFTTPHRYFAYCADANELDCVWISHFHGDHFFGIPLLLLRFWEMGRGKSLFVAGPSGVKEKVEAAMELAYPAFMPRLQYDVDFLEIEPGTEWHVNGADWRTAENIHSERSLALRIDDGEHSLFYSGDGRFTRETLSLAKGCDLAVHEAFWLKKEVVNHGNIVSCLEFADKAAVKHLAVVHVQRNCRRDERNEILQLMRSSPVSACMPESGEIITL